MKTKNNYIIGSSHVHEEFTQIVQNDINEGNIFKNCYFDGHLGMPIWSRYIYENIRKNYLLNKDIVWIVPDFKLNNKEDYDKINLIINTEYPFLDSMGHSENIDKDYLSLEHITTLGFHSINVIDKIVSIFPKIKIIFWSLYVRSRVHKSSYPLWMHYNSIKSRYYANIIDIDLYTSPGVFSTFIRDLGGHPNKEGYFFLDKIIKNSPDLTNKFQITREYISNKTFDFMRGNGDFIARILLNDDGTISLYQHENEEKWFFRNDILFLTGKANNVTSVFNTYEIHNGFIYLIGKSLTNTNINHILKTLI